MQWGLGVSCLEYEEAKKILKAKCGGEMRRRRAYMDQLESALQIKPCDISELERFADLFRVTVVESRNSPGRIRKWFSA